MGFFEEIINKDGEWDEVWVNEYHCSKCNTDWNDFGDISPNGRLSWPIDLPPGQYEEVYVFWDADLIVKPNECPWCKSTVNITKGD